MSGTRKPRFDANLENEQEFVRLFKESFWALTSAGCNREQDFIDKMN